MKTACSKVREWILNIALSPDAEPDAIPPERHISQDLGVSRDTVRRAIKGLIEEGVLESRQGAGTFINRKAVERHNRRKAKDLSIGIVIFEGKPTPNPSQYGWGVLQALIHHFNTHGIRTQLLGLEDSGALTARQILSQKLDGLVWISPSAQCSGTLDCLWENELPVVVVGGGATPKNIRQVVTDDMAGGYMAGEYFLKRAHKQVLFVSRPPSRPFTSDRHEGFVKAMATYGVKHDQALTLSAFEMLGVYNKVRELVRSRKPFTGVFCADGIYLRPVYNAIRDAGKQIPADYSLVTYDHSEPGDCSGIQLVEIHQRLDELGKTAARKLVAILTGRNGSTAREIIKPRLVEGNSCRSIM